MTEHAIWKSTSLPCQVVQSPSVVIEKLAFKVFIMITVKNATVFSFKLIHMHYVVLPFSNIEYIVVSICVVISNYCFCSCFLAGLNRVSMHSYAQETWLSRDIESLEFQLIGCQIQELLERYNLEVQSFLR